MLSQERYLPALGYVPAAARQPAMRRRSEPDFFDEPASEPRVHDNLVLLQLAVSVHYGHGNPSLQPIVGVPCHLAPNHRTW